MPWLHVKLNFISFRRRLSEIIWFRRVETCLKLFQNYFRGLLLLTNISQHVLGGCLELYYCWLWWDSSLISTTNWFTSVLWHRWFGHLTCKNCPRNDLLCVEWDVKPCTLTHRAQPTHWLCASMISLGFVEATTRFFLAACPCRCQPVTSVWNSLPEAVRSSTSLSLSRKTLKTELFMRSYTN